MELIYDHDDTVGLPVSCFVLVVVSTAVSYLWGAIAVLSVGVVVALRAENPVDALGIPFGTTVVGLIALVEALGYGIGWTVRDIVATALAWTVIELIEEHRHSR